MSDNEGKSSQAENVDFETLLEVYADRAYGDGRSFMSGYGIETVAAKHVLLDAIARLQSRQITRGAEIRMLVVGSEFFWLSGYIEGRERHCDTFWRKDFPNGITQTADTLPFNPHGRVIAAAAWNELLMMINALFDEGYAGVRVMEKKETGEGE